MSKIKEYVQDEHYRQLVRHNCTKCGSCCTWPGYVPLYRDDVRIISEKLNLETHVFLNRYCSILYSEEFMFYTLILDKYNGRCPFLVNKLCGIHESKPLTCQAGPFGLNFIRDSENLALYLQNSPSFNGRRLSSSELEEYEELFLKTWREEHKVAKSRSIIDLASYLNVKYSCLTSLEQVTYEDLK